MIEKGSTSGTNNITQTENIPTNQKHNSNPNPNLNSNPSPNPKPNPNHH